jgi:hypothetical protein
MISLLDWRRFTVSSFVTLPPGRPCTGKNLEAKRIGALSLVNRKTRKAEAEALVSAFSEAMDSQLATKSDINRLERELLVLKWMVGLVLGGILTELIIQICPLLFLSPSLLSRMPNAERVW